MTENKPLQPERLPTGVPGLDTILQGGLVKGGVYMVLGMPGAGKTILGNQVCFHHASTGGRALYVTLLAESHARMIGNLSSLAFFEPSRIPESLVYLSAYSVLEEGGLDALLSLIRNEVKARGASLLILDGLVAAEEVAPTERAFKKFIHELQVTTGMVGCTTLLLTTGAGKGLKAEHTMVDGLFVLRERTVGVRAVRELTVRKFRGSGHFRGQHSFDITRRGIIVYPRLEVLVEESHPLDLPAKNRQAFGIKGLDAMLQGGVFPGSSTMLFGTPGSGKTLLGLHFLAEGARQGELAHYFAFYDSPQRVLDQTASVGLHLAPLLEKGHLELSFRPPTENLLDALGVHLVSLIRERGVRRLFIDGFDALKKASIRPARITRFMAALVNECRARGVTMLFSVETPIFGLELRFPVGGVSMIAENILFLRSTEHGSELRRVLSVLKLRTSAHDHLLREFRITEKGFEVGDPIEDVQLLMSGLSLASTPIRVPRKSRFKRRGK